MCQLLIDSNFRKIQKIIKKYFVKVFPQIFHKLFTYVGNSSTLFKKDKKK